MYEYVYVCDYVIFKSEEFVDNARARDFLNRIFS